MSDDTASTVASWFDEDDDLGECPSCGEAKYTHARFPGAVQVCVGCGFLQVGESEAEPPD